MLTHGLAGPFAGVAALLQLAAIALAVRLARRHGFFPAAAVAVGALSLMALRRAGATLETTGLLNGATLPVLQEGVGLAISALLVMAAALATRALGPPSPRDRSSSAELGARGYHPCVHEEERELLCYDLHDGLAQLVFGARMHFDTDCSLRQQDGECAEQELSLAARRLNEAAAEVARVVSCLKLSISQTASLSEAVRECLCELAEAEGWEYDLDDRLEGRRFDPTTEAMTYRVIQEALNNAARHAETRTVKVELYGEDGALVVVVADRGRGFDLAVSLSGAGGLGLRGMRRRAQLVGGHCTIDSRPGAGTAVVMRVPGMFAGSET